MVRRVVLVQRNGRPPRWRATWDGYPALCPSPGSRPGVPAPGPPPGPPEEHVPARRVGLVLGAEVAPFHVSLEYLPVQEEPTRLDLISELQPATQFRALGQDP